MNLMFASIGGRTSQNAPVRGALTPPADPTGLTPLDVAERDLSGTSGAQRQQGETVVALLRGAVSPLVR